MTPEAAFAEVKSNLRTWAAIGRACGLTRQAPRRWSTVPPEFAPALEAATGGAVTCEQMCPGLSWERDGGGTVVAYRAPVGIGQAA